MKRSACLLTVLTVTVALLGGPAHAGHRTKFNVGAGPGAFYAAGKRASQVSHVVHPADVSSLPAGQWVSMPVCGLGGLAICHQVGTCPDGTQRQDAFYLTTAGTRMYESTGCPTPGGTPTPATLTRARILEAFRRLPLPESPLLIQPAGGRTIVNFDTIFYTTRGPFTRVVSLLGHRVRFRIEPSRFTWVWGDGDRRVTSTPGQPFRRGVPVREDITHRYLTRDRFEPHLDTTYTATYSVDGGAARPVGGTVTIAGTPRELVTVTYTPLLVND